MEIICTLSDPLLAVVLAAICVPIIMIWFNAEAILLLLKQEAEVARLAGLYLRWLILGLPAYAFNAIARRYFQSQGMLYNWHFVLLDRRKALADMMGVQVSSLFQRTSFCSLHPLMRS
jgi:hypothetical protein